MNDFTKKTENTAVRFRPAPLQKMVMKKYYYERSRLLESEVNITFEELLWKDDTQTTQWIDELREFVIYEWDTMGVPPTIGQNTDKI